MKYFVIRDTAPGGAGFFAVFSRVLENMLRMEEIMETGIDPAGVIDTSALNQGELLVPYIVSEYPHLYDITNTVTQNYWEYTFEQFLKKEEVYNSPHFFCDGLSHDIIPQQGKNFRNNDLIKKLNKLIKKYIQIKPEILSKLNFNIEKHKTLAVHCRRSDMNIGHSNIALNYDNDIWIQKTLKVFKEKKFEKLYISTEEIEIIDTFKRALPNEILFQDCFRIERNETHLKHDARLLHRTLCAQEVLIDALNMSMCDSLLCGISGVSNGAIYFNNLNYSDVYYFDEIT
jgi:hypothetical protein